VHSLWKIVICYKKKTCSGKLSIAIKKQTCLKPIDKFDYFNRASKQE